MTYGLLTFAILAEVCATLLLKASNGWEKWWFAVISIALYMFATLLFALVLKAMNVGAAYAIWSGVGIGLVCAASALIWQQTLDIYALVGILFIAIGVVIITTKSQVLL